MQIPVTNGVSLTEFLASDKADCVRRINDPEIASRTLRIPHPYAETDFESWLENLGRLTAEVGEPFHFAIREHGSLIGGVGFDDLVKGHRAELGYWLAKSHWGRGIMTNVVRAACEYAISRWQLVRITANVFHFNDASARVLEKNGFVEEGVSRKAFVKNGEFLDARRFAFVK